MNIEITTMKILRVSETKYPSFPLRLQFAMALRGYSSQQLANRLFLTHSTISGYRTGTRTPSCEILYDIAKELQVSSDFLLCLSNYVFIEEISTLPQK